MRIVQINACYEFSSTGRTCYEFHTYLTKHGIESYKFYSKVMPNSDPKDILGNWFDHKLHALLSRIFGKQAYFSTIPTYKLINNLKRIQPDVVILRNFHSNYVNFPMLARYLAENDIPSIIVLHDCWFFTGYCFHYTEVGCDRWQRECNCCPLIKKDKASWFLDTTRTVFADKKRLLENIPRLAVVGVSDWITNEGRKAPIFHSVVKFQRIYNWIDLRVFYPRDVSDLRRKIGIDSTEFVALGVSMLWDYHKGLDVFIELAKKLPDVRFVMIGRMPQVDLPANIVPISPTGSTDELAQYYSLANVLLNFSIQETFGKVTAEALACGTPAIVNNKTANPEIPGPCGFVVNNGNIQQTIDALTTIRTQGKDYYRQMCIDRARALFDKDTNIEQYLQLFNELCSKNKIEN